MIEDIKPTAQTPAATPKPAGKKILCIEDELFIGELYSRALNKAGYDVTIISDGLKGLEAAKTDAYDIILLDIMIPQMLGVDVLHELRKDNKQLRARIIIATNLEQDEKTRSAIEAEADGYIIKAEVTPHQLVEFLSQI